MHQLWHGVVVVAISVAVLGPAGCGEGDPQAGASSTDGSSATVSGKPVTDANQLSGAWFRRGDLSGDHLVGIEFSPDGKTLTFVSADGRGIHEATFPYTLLDGGRIRVTHPQHPTQSQVAVIKVDGLAMSLEPETQSRHVGMIDASFDRLSGKTIAQRLEERVVEIQAEREALRARIAAFIEQPNLVLVHDDAGDVARVALETGDHGRQIAYQRIGDLVVARQAQLVTANQNDGAPTAVLQLGPVVGPPGAGVAQNESVRFTVEPGRGDAVSLVANGTRLREDASLHQTVKRDYEAIVQARRAVIDAFHDQIGHFLLIQAEPTRPNAPPDRMAFLRVDGEDAYRSALVYGTAILMPGNLSQPAAVQLTSGNKAVLMTNSHQIVPEAGGPAGSFIVSTRSGGQRFTTLHRMTREEFEARQAQCTALVAEMKNRPLNLVGVYQSSNNGRLRPVRLTLTSADGKALEGSFSSDALKAELAVTGTVEASMLGLVLKVMVPRVSMHEVPDQMTEAGTLTLNLEFDGDVPVVTGRSQPGDSENRFTLAPPSAENLARLRRAFQDHLKAGGQFKWDRTGTTGGSDEMLTITLTANGADGVTGTAGFRRDASSPVTGRLSEADGLLVLDLTVQPTDPGNRSMGSGPVRLYIIPFEDTFHLSGHSTWAGATRTRYVSYAPVAP